MFRLVRTTSLAVALVIGIAATAWAQGRTGGSGFGGSGFGGGLGGSGFGGSAFGGSGFGGSGFGGSGFGGSGFGGSGFGGSAFGSGFGGSGFGGSGFGGSGFGGSGLGGSGFGGSGMYGGQGGGQAFVGRDSGDMNAVMTQMGRAGTQFFNNMNRNMGAGGRNRNRNNQQAQSEEHVESAVRVKLNVGFPRPQPAANVLADSVRTRLNGVLSTPGIAQPDVTVDGGVIVLRGEAASDTQRAVIAQVVAMEPGVTSVRNEMTVAPAEGEE